MTRMLIVALPLMGRAIGAALPSLNIRASTVSPDGSCGGSSSYTCVGSSEGSCCSQYGYCGSTDAYCGAGCQSGFGTCAGSGATTTTNPSSSSTSTSATSTPTTRGSLADCLGSKDVPVSYVTSSNFAQLSSPYNLHLPHTPAVVVLPTTNQQVSDAVTCAAKSNIKVQARSGGHSYASYSLGGQDGSMVVDLSLLQNITVDSSGIATVGGGVRLGNLALGIYNAAKRALPHGTCPGVGIGGHFTHGGYGYDSRMWGLALDTIIGLDVVIADGSIIHASSTDHTDMFFALRGAADSFGIITTFYLQTQPAPSTVVNFQYGLSDLFTDATKSASYFQHIQDFALNSSIVDRRIGLGIYLDGGGASLSGTFIGTQSEFDSKIAPAMLNGLAISSISVKELGWIDSLIALSGSNTLQVPLTGYSAHDNFFAKSLTVPESSPLTTDALKSYFSYVIQKGVNPPTPWYSIINLYGGPDSQINSADKKDPNYAGYSDRNALWVFQNYGYADQSRALPADTQSFIQGLNDALTSRMSGVDFGGYLNYVDPSLTASQAHDEYYSSDLYTRLLAIKKDVDPNSVFWNPQAIGA